MVSPLNGLGGLGGHQATLPKGTVSRAWGSRARDERWVSADARNYLLSGIKQLLPLIIVPFFLSFYLIRVPAPPSGLGARLRLRPGGPGTAGGERGRTRPRVRVWRRGAGAEPEGRRPGPLERAAPQRPLGDARAGGEVGSAAAGPRTASPPGSCQPGLAPQDCTFGCRGPGRPRELVPLLPGEEQRPPQQPRAASSPEESRGDASPEEQVLFRPILLTFVTLAAHGERFVSPVCYHSLTRSRLLNFFRS